MMAALQEELSRQMHLTAHAVQSAREYKEALRTNDTAYTHLFGAGALQSTDYVRKHNEMRAREAARPSSAKSIAPKTGAEGVSARAFQALSTGRPQSARAALPTNGRTAAPQPMPPATARSDAASTPGPGSQPTELRVVGTGDNISVGVVGIGGGGGVEPPLMRPTSAGAAGLALRPSANAADASSSTRWASAAYERTTSRPQSGAPRATSINPAPPPGPRPYSARAAVMTTPRVVARREKADALGHNTLDMNEALTAAAETTAASRLSVEAYHVDFGQASIPAGATKGRLAGGAAGLPAPQTALTPSGDLAPWA